MIEFKKVVKQNKILNPEEDFEEESIIFEYRTDPLTGRNTTVISGMLEYEGKFLTSDPELLDLLVRETKETCPFCPENIQTQTPMFPKQFLPEGRIVSGEATVVPNILGHAERSILAILSKKHHLQLNEFTPEILLDGFKAAMEYLKRLHTADRSVRFPVFVFNYLTPAGSSIFHPHMQILVRDRPFFLVDLMLGKSREYFAKNGVSFWRDLLDKEVNGERYLFGTEGAEWLVPFAPLRGLNEVQAVVKHKSGFQELSEAEWQGLAEGISKILRFYHAQHYTSFNIIITPGPLDDHLDYFNVNLHIVSRPGIQKYGFTDAWAAPYLLWDGEATEEPERLAQKITRYLKK